MKHHLCSRFFYCVYILLTAFISTPIHADLDSNFSVNLSLVKRATYHISQFYDAVKNDQDLPHMVTLYISNNSSQDAKLKVRLIVTSQLLNQTIFDATTVAFSGGFPITVPAGSSLSQGNAFEIKNTDFSLKNSHQVFSRVDKNQMIDKFKASHEPDGSQPDILATDTYTYTVYVFHKDDSDTLSNAIATATDTVQDIQEFGNIQLISPSAYSSFSIDFFPIFNWTPVQLRRSTVSGQLMVNAYYTLKIWEAIPGAETDFERAAANRPIFNRTFTNLNQYTYTASDERLRPDRTYIWKVYVKDDSNYSIGNGESTDYGIFKIDPIVPAELLGPVGASQESPLFQWTRVTQAYQYRIELSETDSFTTFQELTVPGSGLSYSPDSEVKLEPGKPYFWRVQAYDSVQTKWGEASQINTFYIDSRISNSLPSNGDTLSDYPLFFSWSSLPGSGYYVLQLSKNEQFSQPIEFTTQFTQFMLMKESQKLTPGKYFWRVLAKDSSGRNWGKFDSEVFSFTLQEEEVVQTLFTTEPFIGNTTTVAEQAKPPVAVPEVVMTIPTTTLPAISTLPTTTAPSLVEIKPIAETVPDNQIKPIVQVNPAQEKAPTTVPAPTTPPATALAPVEKKVEPTIVASTPASEAELKEFTQNLQQLLIRKELLTKDWTLKAVRFTGSPSVLYKEDLARILSNTALKIKVEGDK